MAANIRFIQFPHPGREHWPDVGTAKRWNPNTLEHARKFLSLNGEAVSHGERRSGELWAWGEWEPESTLIRELDQPQDDYPRYLWSPHYAPKADYTTLHNTDPFVFGGFYYGNCKQATSPSLEGLRALDPGSVILFGSSRRGAWVIDTVFVVRDFIDYDATNYREVLRDAVPDAYWDVMLAPTFANPMEPGRWFRLYRGATYDSLVGGMFSFFPAIPPIEDRGFPRPAIELPAAHFSVGLRQGAKGHGRWAPSLSATEVRELWDAIRAQVEDAGIELGVAATVPSRQDVSL